MGGVTLGHGDAGIGRYVALMAMSLLYFLLMTSTFNALGVILPAMVAALGLTWTQAGFGFTLLGLSCGLSSLLPAFAIRKIGVSLTLVLGGAVLAAGFVCFGVAYSVLLYYVGATLVGLGFTMVGTVPAVHVIAGVFERRSTALGAYFTIGGIGSVAGPLLFRMTEHLLGDWRPYWIACAVAATCAAAFAALVTSSSERALRVRTAASLAAEIVPAGAEQGWQPRRAMATPQFYVVVGSYTAFLLVNTTVHSFAPQHMGERGLTADGAALVISAAAAVGALGSIVAGVIGERIDARGLTIASLLAVTIGTLGLGFATGALGFALFVFGMGTALGFSYVGTAMLMLDYFGKRANLELYSVMQLIGTSAALGPLLGGSVRDATGSFGSVFIACAAVSIVMLLLVLTMRRPVLEHAVEPRLATIAG